MPRPYLHSKFQIPPLREKFVRRRRLTEIIDTCIDHNLTIVSAQAGFGKTTILSEWALSHKKNVTWFSLDKEDNNPINFWKGLNHSLCTLAPEITNYFAEISDTLASSSIKPMLGELLNEIGDKDRSCIIILDDFHLIVDQAICDDLAFFIDRFPSNFHLIISTRTSLLFPLGRLRARGLLNEIGTSDLRFTDDEAVLFLNDVMGLDLSRKDIAILESRSEGWAAALQLAALSLRGKDNVSDFISSFHGGHRYVTTFLMEEVYLQQPEIIQSFLLKTSILDQLNNALCDAVTGREDSQKILEQLEEENLFLVPIDEERNWYRYQTLFRDFLSKQAKQRHPELVVEIHYKAGLWFEENNLIRESISHALEVNNLDRVIKLIMIYGMTLMNRGEFSQLHHWLDELPEQVLRSNPILCFFKAAVLVPERNLGQYDVIKSYIRDMERLFGHNPHSHHYGIEKWPIDPELLKACATLAQSSHYRDKGEKIEKIVEPLMVTLDQLDKENDEISGFFYNIMVDSFLMHEDIKSANRILSEKWNSNNHHGNQFHKSMSDYYRTRIALLEGKLTEASNICRKTITFYKKQDRPFKNHPTTIGVIYLCLGEVLLEWNQLQEAEQIIEQGLKFTAFTKEWGPLTSGYAALIRLKIAKGEKEESISDEIDKMEKAGRYRQGSANFVKATKVLTLIRNPQNRDKNLTEAWQISQQINVESQGKTSQAAGSIETNWQRHIQLLLIRYYIISLSHSPKTPPPVDAPKIHDLLEKQLISAKKQGRTGMVIEVHMLLALLLHAQKEMNPAISHLEEALKLAEAENFVRLFADEGKPMRELLGQAVIQGIHIEYCGRLLSHMKAEEKPKASIGSGAKAIDAPISATLSNREIQVLRLMVAGLSNQNIAKELFISKNTVKTHIASIFEKLYVNKRVQAISKAKETGLL